LTAIALGGSGEIALTSCSSAAKPYLYAGTSGNSGRRSPSSSSSFKGRISEDRDSGKDFEHFQKTLDPIWRLAAKGGLPDDESIRTAT